MTIFSIASGITSVSLFTVVFVVPISPEKMHLLAYWSQATI